MTLYMRHLTAVLTAILIAALPVRVDIHGVEPANAYAQSDGKKQTLFDLLFNKNKKPAPQAKKPAVRRAPPKRATTTQKRPRTVKKSAPSRSGQGALRAGPASSAETPEKSENARKVLVVGDFVAEGIAKGLKEAFEQTASVIVEARTSGSSGLVRDDYYDWPEEIGAILESVSPDILVIELGSNDRQVLRVDGTTQQVRSDAWSAEYARRVDGLLDAIAEHSVPVVWTGAPPYKFKSMSADILSFNEVYRSAVEARSGHFVDIWDGFVDEEGRFIMSGADIKGQTVRLRASDGINFTNDGKRKLAFYVERQLKLMLGDDASPLLTSLAPDSLPILKLPPLQTESQLERTNPIGMLDPDLDGGSVLLGDVNDLRAGSGQSNPLAAKSVRQLLVEDGTPPPARPGREGSYRVSNAALPATPPPLMLPDSAPVF